PSQSARNTLAAGVPQSYNSAQFLGHLPGRRGARGPVPIGPGALLVIDEASMLSSPDLADLIAYAQARGAKIILAGDIHQLQAVENGGGMSLLAAALGYARLAEPARTLRRELNRRIRDDLITLGIVSAGPAVTIADGTPASAGDLIICTRNDHRVEAGEPGRALANGDLLRIEAITRNGLLVRRAL